MPFIGDFAAEMTHKVVKKSDVIVAGDFDICLMKSTTNTMKIKERGMRLAGHIHRQPSNLLPMA